MRITLKGDTLVLAFDPTPALLSRVRALPSRRFDAATGAWLVPHTKDNWAALEAAGFPLAGLARPTGNGQRIEERDGLLVIHVPYSPLNAQRCSSIPDHRLYDAVRHLWFCKPTRANLIYLKDAFPDAGWAPAAEALYAATVRVPAAAAAALSAEKVGIREAGDVPVPDYIFGGPPPFAHQKQAFLLSRDLPAFALFMEQRTGKTKIIIDTACWLFARGKIRQVLVIAPNSVKTNWVTDELPAHMPAHVGWAAWYWGSRERDAGRPAGQDSLLWFVMNVEALSTERGQQVAADFVKSLPTMIVVDESTRIKTPSAKRTRAIVKLSRHAPFRRILTGTPVTQGPLDLYAPFKFLDPGILGFSSFYSFRNHFAVMGGWNGKEVVTFQRLDELQRLVEPYSFRVTRDECFDLPPKGYQKLVVDLTLEQRRLYDQMRDHMMAELSAVERVTAPIVLTQLLRLQQIVGGFVPADLAGLRDPTLDRRAEPIPGGNAKLDALLELVEDVQGKVIVWARFRAEIAAIAAVLREQHGASSTVEFHGGVDDDARVRARTAFQDPASPVRFFVGQTETGGLGIDLAQARTVVYFSNSFSLESRLQSEDRAQGPRQRHSVAYVDLVARNTIDEKLLTVLRTKQDTARVITGDSWREWV